MSDEIEAVVFSVLFFTGIVIIESIRNKENILYNLSEFFGEWWHVIKTVTIPVIIFFLLLSYMF